MTELNEKKNFKKLFSKITLGAMLLACSAAFALGVLIMNNNKAAAAGTGSESSFKMMTGGSIRLDKDAYGLRFTAEIGAAPEANEEYHMMIFPAAYISNYSLTAESDFVAALEDKTTIDMVCEPFTPETSDGTFTAGNWYVRGSVTGIKYSHINGEFFGIAYKSVQDGENVTREYAAYTEGENVRSVVYVASGILARGDYSSDADATAILKTLVKQGINSANGVDEVDKDNPYSDFSLEFSKYSIALGESKTLAVNGMNEKTDLAKEWKSDNTAVATVDENGTITAVAEGNANVSFETLGKTYTCAVKVTSEHLIDSTDKIYDWDNRYEFSVVNAAEAQGLPKGVDTENTEYIKAVPKAGVSNYTLQPTLNISSVLNNLDSYNDYDYLSVKLYNGYSSYWPIVYLTTHPSYNDAAVSTAQNTAVYKKALSGWIELRVKVSLLRSMMSDGKNANYKYIRFEDWQNSSTAPCYYQSWEMVRVTEYGESFDGTGYVEFVNSNMNVSVVNVKDETGSLPQGISEDRAECIKAEFKVTTAANTCFPYFDISPVIANIESFKDTDYISIRIYSDASYWGYFYLATTSGTKSAQKPGTVVKEDGTAWKEVRITVAQIKELLNDGKGNAYACLMLDNWRDASDVAKPFYYHSWELVEA